MCPHMCLREGSLFMRWGPHLPGGETFWTRREGGAKYFGGVAKGQWKSQWTGFSGVWVRPCFFSSPACIMYKYLLTYITFVWLLSCVSSHLCPKIVCSVITFVWLLSCMSSHVCPKIAFSESVKYFSVPHAQILCAVKMSSHKHYMWCMAFALYVFSCVS